MQVPAGVDWGRRLETVGLTLTAPIFGTLLGLGFRSPGMAGVCLIGWIALPLTILFLARPNAASCVGMIVGVLLWFTSGILLLHGFLLR